MSAGSVVWIHLASSLRKLVHKQLPSATDWDVFRES
jgi:hypothetical protein